MKDLLCATALVGVYAVITFGTMGYALYHAAVTVSETAVAAWDFLSTLVSK